MTKPHPSHAPATYRIKVQEILDTKWSEGFEKMAISFEGGGTILTGPVADQAALHGLLMRIRDLNLNLLSVERLEPLQANK
ncbi:MAG: hypothetical protein PVH26_08100 [Desulfosarcina sp.]|jgi:hypothetical protein